MEEQLRHRSVYTIDAPVNVVGGADFNRLGIVGSDFDLLPNGFWWSWWDGNHHPVDIMDRVLVSNTARGPQRHVSGHGAGRDRPAHGLPRSASPACSSSACRTSAATASVTTTRSTGTSGSLDGVSSAGHQDVKTFRHGLLRPRLQDGRRRPQIQATVATTTVGQVIVRESGGSTLVPQTGRIDWQGLRSTRRTRSRSRSSLRADRDRLHQRLRRRLAVRGRGRRRPHRPRSRSTAASRGSSPPC